MMRFPLSALPLVGLLSCFRGGANSSSSGGPLPSAISGEAPTPRLLEEEGTGRCDADADCVLSDYQPGCCTQACELSAISKADLNAALAKEGASCDAFREPELCPPPDPCPSPARNVVSAKCVKETCYRVVEGGPK